MKVSPKKLGPWISFAAGIAVVVIGALVYRYFFQNRDSFRSSHSPSLSSPVAGGANEQSIPMTRSELSESAREAVVECLGSAYLSVSHINDVFQLFSRNIKTMKDARIEWENIYFSRETGAEQRLRYDSSDSEARLEQFDGDGFPVPVDLTEEEQKTSPLQLLERYRKNYKVHKTERHLTAEVESTGQMLSWKEKNDDVYEIYFQGQDRSLKCAADPEQPLLELCHCEKPGEASH